ncbi:MAG: DNA repair protein RecO [Rhizobiales bacterium]|nr:DNA repair protein RecO [Hyphomicrobiales bacterium]
MEWRDEGIILAVRPHGETAAIAEILTQGHGRCLGLVRGGRGRRLRPLLQPGNHVDCVWHARLEEHLGHFVLEPLHLQAGLIIDEPLRLLGVSSLTALAQLLPEREPHPRLFSALQVVLESIDHDDVWPALLVRWEMGLLDELGFGLDLSKCAATGQSDDLRYVSPKSGRAVSREAGLPYHQRLFQLPPFLRGGGTGAEGDVIDGMRLTGYFLERHVFGPRAVDMPQARQMLQEKLGQRTH